MVKKTASKHNILTQEFLIQELRDSEQRLEQKLEKRFIRLEIQTESLKDYIDSAITQVTLKIDSLDGRLSLKIDNLDKKVDVSVKGLVDLIVQRTGATIKLERRLETLEAKR